MSDTDTSPTSPTALEQAAGGGLAAPAAAALSPAAEAVWQDSLPDDMKEIDDLRRIGSIPDLAKAYLDTKRHATSRMPRPGDTEESFKLFADALRPESADVYEIDVPEGMSSEFADSFRAKAHELGIPPQWVKPLVEWNNEFVSAGLAKENAASQESVDAFKKSYGAGFDEKMDKVRAWLPRMGVDLSEEDMAQLDVKMGSGNLLSFMFQIHDRVGDMDLPGGGEGQGGAGFGAMSPAQAETTWNEKVKDPSWRAKAKIEGSAEHAESQRLNRLIAQGRVNRRT